MVDSLSGSRSLALILALLFFGYSGNSFADQLLFGWPAPASATIEATRTDKGKTGKSTYRMTTRRDSDGTLLVEFGDVRLLEIDGRPVAEGSLAPEIEALLKLVPSFRIDSVSGQITEVIGFSEMVDGLLRSVLDAEAQPALRALLTDPRMQRLLAAKAADDWNAWAGAWVGLELKPGESAEIQTELEGHGGMIPVLVSIAHEGYSTEYKGAVDLRLISVSSGPEMRKAMYDMVTEMFRALPPRKPITLDDIESATRTGTVRATVSPQTLQPYRVATEELTELSIRGEGKSQMLRRKEFTFTWHTAGSEPGGRGR